MSSIEGFVDYTKREFCHDVKCPVQTLLDKQASDAEQFEFTRGICKSNCIHSTHEFHAWLIEKGYLVVRPIK